MNCQNCHHEFCWLCMNEYNSHLTRMCKNIILTPLRTINALFMIIMIMKFCYASDVFLSILLYSLNTASIFIITIIISVIFGLIFVFMYFISIKKTKIDKTIVVIGLTFLTLNFIIIYYIWKSSEMEQRSLLHSFSSIICVFSSLCLGSTLYIGTK